MRFSPIGILALLIASITLFAFFGQLFEYLDFKKNAVTVTGTVTDKRVELRGRRSKDVYIVNVNSLQFPNTAFEIERSAGSKDFELGQQVTFRAQQSTRKVHSESQLLSGVLTLLLASFAIGILGVVATRRRPRQQIPLQNSRNQVNS